jgi:DNA (cytosine-5)-methyltransferase 1
MYQLPLSNELIVDNFAGGGGASLGIEMALGRPVNISVNHDPEAVAMHAINHPITRHYCEDVWDVRPMEVCEGKPVALAWFSPDCKHFSKAKGGKPVEKKIRGLAWVVIRWAATVAPNVIVLENVEEFTTWGPLLATGMPDPSQKGKTFQSFVTALRHYGYHVEWKEMRACDYGAPTIRKRLFLIARRDGKPIVWPKPTHGPGLIPYLTAASCIDWSIPCPSIFDRDRPLAENTMRRVAKGVMKYVVNAQEPFIVNLTHGGRVEPSSEPLRTITCAKRGEKALVVPTLAPFVSTYYGDKNPNGDARGGFMDDPLHTQTTENRHAVVAAFLAQHNTDAIGRPAGQPMATIVSRGTQTQLVAASILKMRGSASRDKHGQPIDEPLHTISAGGTHFAQVQAFLLKYYGTDQAPELREPLHTLTTRDRFGLVTVHGEDYAIVDIGMRMLAPRELYRAQGFPDSYIIDRALFAEKDDHGVWVVTERPLTKTAQVRMCGNSVCPPMAKAIVAANVPQSQLWIDQRAMA